MVTAIVMCTDGFPGLAGLTMAGHACDLSSTRSRGSKPISAPLTVRQPRVSGALTWTRQGWWAGDVAGPVAFVGRERELSRLLGALSGHARMVLVVGDAGVGKTRFAAEGMARAAAAGVVMVRGECLPLAGSLPLLPVAQALGGLERVP